MNITDRERRSLLITLLVILACSVFNFIYLPLSERNKRLNYEISTARSKLTEYISLLAREDSLRDEYNAFFDGNAQLLNEEDMVAVLSALEKTAKDDTVSIIDMRPQIIADMPDTKSYIVEVRAEGSMESFIKFFYDLESSFSFLSLEQIALNVRPQTSIIDVRMIMAKRENGD